MYISTIAFLVTILFGKFLIPILHKLKFGQNIREDGPKSHQKKSGTPTMGGLIFISSTVILMAVANKSYNFEGKLVVYSLVSFGAIGFIDDMMSILGKKNQGLTPFMKIILLTIVSLFIIHGGNMGSNIIIPFINKSVDLQIFNLPFIVFYFLTITNGSNLTDGVDGLATSVSVIILAFLAIASFISLHYSLSLFSGILSASLLGFLYFNWFPAKVIMGDTGSLALGGAIATIGMLLKSPLLIILIGAIYIVEILSVIIQVTVFKITGRRIFKMSPLHHHFELSGWKETEIVILFSMLTLFVCLFSFKMLF